MKKRNATLWKYWRGIILSSFAGSLSKMVNQGSSPVTKEGPPMIVPTPLRTARGRQVNQTELISPSLPGLRVLNRASQRGGTYWTCVISVADVSDNALPVPAMGAVVGSWSLSHAWFFCLSWLSESFLTLKNKSPLKNPSNTTYCCFQPKNTNWSQPSPKGS